MGLVVDVGAPTVDADRDLISRVLANLIDNAIRYAPEGSDVRISVAPAHEGVELAIADTGPGVPPELRAAAFERFHTSDRATGRNRGLGLTFCKLAVEAHRGKIWIDGGDPGAVLRVHLPSRD